MGLYGGVGPAEPLYLHGVVGGWLGLSLGDLWRLELSGSFQDGLESRTDLARFLDEEALLDPADPLADRTLWTAELLLRAEPLRGRVALLQTTAGHFTLHLGGGLGLRALDGAAGAHLAPAGVAAGGFDLRPLGALLLRLDLRAFAALRREASLGLGAELLLGVGTRL